MESTQIKLDTLLRRRYNRESNQQYFADLHNFQRKQRIATENLQKEIQAQELRRRPSTNDDTASKTVTQIVESQRLRDEDRLSGLIELAEQVRTKDDEYRRFESPYLEMWNRMKGHSCQDKPKILRRQKLAKSKLGPSHAPTLKDNSSGNESYDSEDEHSHHSHHHHSSSDA
jgi:hypothetical protein